jgi:hypothetical protein
LPTPWTVFLIILTGAFTTAVLAFAGAARYVSPTLAAENVRFSRFPQPVQYASDKRTVWAFVPCKGWSYASRWLNSTGNPAVAILPAAMLEQSDSENYLVARCKLWHLSPIAAKALARKRNFSRILERMGHTEERPLEVYWGFHSTTLHPDAVHVHSPADLSAFARNLSIDSREYTRGSKELSNELRSQLELWKTIQGSDALETVVRNEMKAKTEGE